VIFTIDATNVTFFPELKEIKMLFFDASVQASLFAFAILQV